MTILIIVGKLELASAKLVCFIYLIRNPDPMGVNFNKIILFSIIPLILSLGIAPALPFANAGMSEAVDCRDDLSQVNEQSCSTKEETVW